MLNGPMKEALLEAARLVLMSVVANLLLMIESGSIDWRVVFTGAIVVVLRFTDKILHELGKENNDPMLTKGLTRF